MQCSNLVRTLVLGALCVACNRTNATNDAGPVPSSVAKNATTLSETIDAGSAPVVTVEVPEVRVRQDAETTIQVHWVTPEGTTVNDEAPFRVRWNRSEGLFEAPTDFKSTGSAVKDGFTVKVRPTPGTPNATLGGEITIVVCDSVTHSVCVPVRRLVELGFVTAKDAAPQTTVSIPLPAAK
jgi:hypothetical protein